MHNSKDPDYTDSNIEADLLRGNLSNPPLLTPTGKISHAKTRVYTQRYRKAWEQMPDFKGWLTSVSHQPTRAFCTYCRKNLHAHRLSLLKHTCTMKHQRGALMHQKETNDKAAAAAEEQKLSHDDDDHMQDEHDGVEEGGGFKLEDEDVEDDDDDIEYVVERLDDEEIEDDQSKDVEDEDYAVDGDEDPLPVAKKIKSDKVGSTNRPDTLAEAMAHVHGEYLDENGEPVNVELEMVVESEDTNTQEMRIVSVRSEREEDQQIGIESFAENDENSAEYLQDHEKENDHDNQPIDHAGTASSCKSSVIGESSDAASETDETDQLALRIPSSISNRRDFSNKSSSRTRTISVLPATSSSNGNTIQKSKKTITLTSGGKTVTLDTSNITTFSGGSRFLLNSKGQGSTIVIGEKGDQAIKKKGLIKISQHQQISANTATVYSATPGTSQSNQRKQIILKSVKPLVVNKPCISTHVLDTSKGLPVGGLQISLYKLMDGRWTFVHESNTTADGRCMDLIDTTNYSFTAGRYKLHFDVDKYFTLRRIETMYPFIEIIFDVKNPSDHHHIPVLISPFGYTTYRGS